MRFRRFYFLFFILISVFSLAQKTKRLPLKNYKIAVLNDILRETSGLTLMNGKLYSFNDGGNSNEIYEINPENGQIISTIKVDFPNRDWEAMTNDGNNLYVGDFGNNGGKRTDLAIYKILDNSHQKISFKYKNQPHFSFKKDKHDFDAEAMIFKDGKIYLFSKEWASLKVSKYMINPDTEEEQSIEKTEEFKTNFLVTDAFYFNKKLYLVGYNKVAKAFLMIFDEDENGNFFSGKYTKYKLGSVFKYGQIEGVAVDEKGIYISGEEFKKISFQAKQSLYFVPFERL